MFFYFSSYFFFFKQKTAYEMRISDWSSDVCSSDLAVIQKIFGALESLGQFFPNGVLDECIGFGNLNIAQHGVAGRYTASRGIGKDNDIGEIGRASCRERVCQYV